jgi:predicted CoA-binding protein
MVNTHLCIMSAPVTLVLGASPEPTRYAHMAVLRLRAHGRPVIAVGKRPGTIGDVGIVGQPAPDAVIDTVTIYLAPRHQSEWEERILEWHPRRIIFNPGAEHPQLAHTAAERGIEVVNGCTLVMLAVGNY